MINPTQYNCIRCEHFGSAEIVTYSDVVGSVWVMGMKIAKCWCCGQEFVPPELIKYNNNIIYEALADDLQSNR